jgi:hypothetical protein
MLRIMILVLVFGFAACKKDKAITPMEELTETVDTAAALKYSGSFINGPSGNTSGAAKIYKQADGKYVLKLENLKVNSDPNLHVLLSKELDPKTFSDLGSLKSTKGNQVYQIDADLDAKPYAYVLIHCVDYNHLFGSAAL